MWFYKTMLPASWLLLLALISISSASIKTQIRRPIPVDVDDVMTREYTEVSVPYEVICAAATSGRISTATTPLAVLPSSAAMATSEGQ